MRKLAGWLLAGSVTFLVVLLFVPKGQTPNWSVAPSDTEVAQAVTFLDHHKRDVVSYSDNPSKPAQDWTRAIVLQTGLGQNNNATRICQVRVVRLDQSRETLTATGDFGFANGFCRFMQPGQWIAYYQPDHGDVKDYSNSRVDADVIVISPHAVTIRGVIASPAPSHS